jgi:hypothetical protein
MPTLVDVPSLGRIEFPDGMNDDAIASSIKDLLSKQQGGEQNEQSQPEANTDSNEQRQGNKQVQPSNEAGLQPSEVQLPESQGQEQLIGNVNPDLSISAPFQIGGENIAKKEQATEGSQGQEAGKGLRGQVPSGNQAQVGRAFGVQPPKQDQETLLGSAYEAGLSGYKGLGTMSSELGRYIWDLSKNIISANVEVADAILGKNSYTEGVRKNILEKGDKYYADQIAGSRMSPDEAKKPLNQFVFGAGHMLGDLVLAGMSGGESALARGAGALAETPAIKAIAEQAIHGMKAFTAPSLIASNEAITKAKEEGEDDSSALAEGMKTLFETELGAALPMNVSSGLKSVLARTASKVLQATPLAVAQGELVQAARNSYEKAFGDNEYVQPTISENIVEGNFETAAMQLAQSAPMGLLGAMGGNTRNVGKRVAEVGLPETAAVIEEPATAQPKVRYSSETQLLEDTTRRLNELKAKPAEELTAEEANELEFLRGVPSTEDLASGYGVSVRKPTYSSEEIIQSKIADATTELESLSAKETLNQREAKRKTRLENEIQKNQELLDTGKTLEAETARKEAAKNKTTYLPEKIEAPVEVETPTEVAPIEAIHYSHEPLSLSKEGYKGKLKYGDHPVFGEGFYAMLPESEKTWTTMDRLILGKNRNKVTIDAKNPLIVTPDNVIDLYNQAQKENSGKVFESWLSEKAKKDGNDALVIKGFFDKYPQELRDSNYVKTEKILRDNWTPQFEEGRTSGRFLNGDEYDRANEKAKREVWGMTPDELNAVLLMQDQIFVSPENSDIVTRSGEKKEVAPTEPTAPKEVNSFTEAKSPEEVDAFLQKTLKDFEVIQSISSPSIKDKNALLNKVRKEAIARNKQLRAEAKQKPVVTSLDNGKPRATPKKEKPLPKKPKGKRVLAAAYERPSDGKIFYGANHKEALLDAGMSWKDIQSKYGNPSQRESPEFGYKTDSNEFVTRREAEQVGAISKQIDMAGREADKQIGLDLHSNRLSLDEFPAFKAPEFSMGAARPSEFGDKKAFQDALVKGTQAHESIKGEVTFDKWKSAFLSGLNKGGRFTESKLKSIFQESEGLNAYAKSFGKNPADIIDFPELWSGKSAAEIEALSKSKRPEDIDLTNQNIDQLREGLGFEPIMRQEAEKWGNVWKEAMLQINANTATITSLISQLRTRPRALTPVEKATLRYATLDALHTLDQKTRLLASATDRVEQKKYNQEYEQASRELNELLEIESRTASASGLSLNAVKLINRANFNVTSMINQYKAAKKTYTKIDGKAETKLSDAEITKIREQSKALVDALKARDEAIQEAKILEADKSISDFLETAKKDRQAGEKITDLSVDEQISQYTMEIETADGDSMNRGVAIRGLARALSEKLNTTDVAVVSKEVHERIKDIMGKEWNENTTKDALAGNGIFGQTTKSSAFGSLRTLERRRANFERDLKIAMKAKTQKERDLKMAKLLERNRVDVKELEPQIQDLTEIMMTRISKLMGDLKNNELRPCE